MFTTSILIFALIAVHAQAFALWVQSIRLTNNRISKSNYGDDITDAVPVFLFSAPTGTPYTILFRENVLSGTKGPLKPVLYEENVLGGTKVVYRTELKPSVSTQFRSGQSSGRRRYVSVLRPEVRADMPG